MLFQFHDSTEEQTLLARYLIIIRGECGCRLSYIGCPLSACLGHDPCTLKKQAALLTLLHGHGNGSLAIEHVDEGLEDILCHVVLLCLKTVAAGQHGSLSRKKVVVSAQTVEQRDGGRQTVTVVECANVSIDVCLRIDGTTTIVLSIDTSTHGGEEGADVPQLFYLVVIKIKFALTHIVVVLDGIRYTPVHAPCVLTIDTDTYGSK